MVKADADKLQVKAFVFKAASADIGRYYRSLVKILERVEIDDCNPKFREDLTNVYELLAQLKAQGVIDRLNIEL